MMNRVRPLKRRQPSRLFRSNRIASSSPMCSLSLLSPLLLLSLSCVINLSTAEAPCGPCFGAGDPGQCCNTCDDVARAYKKKHWAFNRKDFGLCRDEDAAKANSNSNNNNNGNNNKNNNRNVNKQKTMSVTFRNDLSDPVTVFFEGDNKRVAQGDPIQPLGGTHTVKTFPGHRFSYDWNGQRHWIDIEEGNEFVVLLGGKHEKNQDQNKQPNQQQKNQQQFDQKKKEEEKRKQREAEQKRKEEEKRRQQEIADRVKRKHEEAQEKKRKEEETKKKAGEDVRKRAEEEAKRKRDEEETKKKNGAKEEAEAKRQREEEERKRREANEAAEVARRAKEQEANAHHEQHKEPLQDYGSNSDASQQDQPIVNKLASNFKHKIDDKATELKHKVEDKIHASRENHPALDKTAQIIEKTAHIVGDVSHKAIQSKAGQAAIHAAKDAYDRASHEAAEAAHRLADKVAPTVSAKYIPEDGYSFIGKLLVLAIATVVSIGALKCLTRRRRRQGMRMYRGKEKREADMVYNSADNNVEEGARRTGDVKAQPFQLYHEFEYTMRKRYQSNSYAHPGNSPPSIPRPDNAASSTYTYRQHSYGKDGQPVTVTTSVEEFKDKPVMASKRRGFKIIPGTKRMRLVSVVLGSIGVAYAGAYYVMPADMSFGELWLFAAEGIDRLLGHRGLVL